MAGPDRRALVPRRDPLSTVGGKVPLGKIPADARPADAVRTLPAPADAAAAVDAAGLEEMVSVGAGYYDRRSVRGRLGIDDAELDALVRSRVVLALRCGDGTYVYPAWQFTAGGEVVPFLGDVLRALARGMDDGGWTWALWLTAPRDDGRTAIDTLASGGDPRPILRDAVLDAGGWAS